MWLMQMVFPSNGNHFVAEMFIFAGGKNISFQLKPFFM